MSLVYTFRCAHLFSPNGAGGDFVGTCSYTISPRGPLSWLDPGVFGTLGVGAGFSLGAKAIHPEKEVWILYGGKTRIIVC
jgi:hypothetical protein